MKKILLAALLVSCVDPKSVAQEPPTVPQGPSPVELRVQTVEGRLDHLTDCLISKMTMASSEYSIRLGVMTCVTAARKP